jgi:tRNA-dihydrouridine synthase
MLKAANAERRRAFERAQQVRLGQLFLASAAATSSSRAGVLVGDGEEERDAVQQCASTAAAADVIPDGDRTEAEVLATAVVAEPATCALVSVGAEITTIPATSLEHRSSVVASSPLLPLVQSPRPQRAAALGFAHHLVAAPMVGVSDLAFRLLCRRHGTQLCYTEMLHSDRLVSDAAAAAANEPDCTTAAAYLAKYFRTCAADRPLVAQLCGNDADTLLAAARLLEASGGVDAVDLNLGCPQRHARTHGYGAYMLSPAPDARARLLHIVATLSRNLRLPLFCKVRALPCSSSSYYYCANEVVGVATEHAGWRQQQRERARDRGGCGGGDNGSSSEVGVHGDDDDDNGDDDEDYDEQEEEEEEEEDGNGDGGGDGGGAGGRTGFDVEATVQLACALEAAGCRLLAVHGRTCDPRNGHKRRRNGPANLEVVRAVKQAVRIPVLSNGNIRTRADVIGAAAATGADGVMSACAMLVRTLNIIIIIIMMRALLLLFPRTLRGCQTLWR